MMVHRRDVLRLGAAIPASLAASRLLAAPTGFDPRPGAWRRFEVATRIELPAKGKPAQAWIPLAQVSEADWSRPLGQTWTTNAPYADVRREGRYGVSMLHLRWDETGAGASAEVRSLVETRDRAVALTPKADAPALSADDRRLFTASTDLIPTDGVVRETALRIAGARSSDLEKARAVYAWVVENTFRVAAVRGCGVGDVSAMLTSGYLGGKCADLNALYVGLVRSLGIPARDVYGLRVAPSAFGYRSLGANSETVTKAQHCRAETWIEGVGWVPTDPADVRKVALEEPPGDRPLADAAVQAANAKLFGAWEGNWMAYNVGHDVTLPGSSEARQNFFMYPEAEVAGVRLDCLSPDSFRYTITAKEIAST